jgi:hypothetical protein
MGATIASWSLAPHWAEYGPRINPQCRAGRVVCRNAPTIWRDAPPGAGADDIIDGFAGHMDGLPQGAVGDASGRTRLRRGSHSFSQEKRSQRLARSRADRRQLSQRGLRSHLAIAIEPVFVVGHIGEGSGFLFRHHAITLGLSLSSGLGGSGGALPIIVSLGHGCTMPPFGSSLKCFSAEGKHAQRLLRGTVTITSTRTEGRGFPRSELFCSEWLRVSAQPDVSCQSLEGVATPPTAWLKKAEGGRLTRIKTILHRGTDGQEAALPRSVAQASQR